MAVIGGPLLRGGHDRFLARDTPFSFSLSMAPLAAGIGTAAGALQPTACTGAICAALCTTFGGCAVSVSVHLT
jgi:hypothetical protein